MDEEAKSATAPESVPERLARYHKRMMFQNHDFGAKAIDGLFRIASGELSYELAPRGGKSLERYELTASAKDCQGLLEHNVNAEQIRAIVDTVHSLLGDPRAEELLHDGRVWLTTGKIVEELLRTSAGTVRARNSKVASEMVEAVLVAITGARMRATDPDGKVTNLVYVLDAVRLTDVTIEGRRYRDVWGFAVRSETLARRAERMGRAHLYPLAERAQPFTLDTVWIEHYLSNLLHEARNRLLSKDKVVVRRSWKRIFEIASPQKPLSYRQKSRLIEGFEQALTDLAREEARGLRHDGSPLYVRAWSERDAARGRGKGEYRMLCVEATKAPRAVRDGVAGHGSVNLRGDEGGEAPGSGRRCT